MFIFLVNVGQKVGRISKFYFLNFCLEYFFEKKSTCLLLVTVDTRPLENFYSFS